MIIATTSCKNVYVLCAKNGFTYLNGLQIANLSQNNNQPPSLRFNVVHLRFVRHIAQVEILERGEGEKITRDSTVKSCLSLRQDVSTTFATGCLSSVLYGTQFSGYGDDLERA